MFDGSEEEEDVEGSRLPLLIVLALLVLAMFGGVVWLAYTQGVARGRGETPVLTAAGGPERGAPQDPGGGNVPYQGFKIYEQPAPPDDSAEPAPAAHPAPAPQASAPKAVEPKTAESKTAESKAAEAKAVATPPKAAAAPAAEAKTPPPAKTVAALIQQANSEPAKPVPAAKPPAAKPAAAPSAAAPATGPATGAPRQLSASVSAPAVTKPAPAAGGFVLQIGAYKSQADAATAWKTYQAKHAALLGGYSNNVQQVDLGEKGTWYRLRIGGFADREVATALCDRLKADGGACIPGR
ncbi:MAG TPA: SPOR domain-containing protein [Rhizomicrobium sp.]|nr:SPOR domain-containing protein [Rhizomicrobium sp.]